MPISETYYYTYFQLWTGIVKTDDTKWLIIKNVRGQQCGSTNKSTCCLSANLSSTGGLTWWKKKAGSHKLSSDTQRHTKARIRVKIHTYILPCNKEKVRKRKSIYFC